MNLITPLVDVIMLSYCKTQREYQLTLDSLKTLLACKASSAFRIILVETASRATFEQWYRDEPFGHQVQMVFPEIPFHYNQFLQFGFDRLTEPQAPYVLISNNDVLFAKDSITTLIEALGRFESVSPWCPGFHEQYLDAETPYHVGFRTSIELCGWGIMFRRSILQTIPFKDLFPLDFSFWFQDNYYGFQLHQHGLRHALVRAAHVVHLCAQSHGLIGPEHYIEFTSGALDAFKRRTMQDSDPADACVLTFAIPAQMESAEGRDQVARLVKRLDEQAKEKPVEVLALIASGNMTIGEQCRALASWANGQYIGFLLPGDEVSSDFVAAHLEMLQHGHRADALRRESARLSGNVAQVAGMHVAQFGRDARAGQKTRCVCLPASCVRELLQQEDGQEWLLSDTRTTIWGPSSPAPGFVYSGRSVDDALVGGGPLVPIEAAQQIRAGEILLTVCVLTLPSRVNTCFAELTAKLTRQSAGKPVEILAFLDNKRSRVGSKRNALLQLARGRYVCFVDDDDDVADHYVDSLLMAVNTSPEPDCVVFDAWVTVDGRLGKSCRYGIEFQDRDLPEEYQRSPNHLCCIRRELAQSTPFEPINRCEDARWAAAIRPRLKTQVRIPRVLYHYRFDTGRSETAGNAIRQKGDTVVDTSKQSALAGGKSTDWCTVEVRPEGRVGESPIFGFWHVAILPGWQEIVAEQMLKLQASGLYGKTRRIFVGLAGATKDEFDIRDDKLEIIACVPSLSAGELPTLECLHRFCQQHEGLVYYIHTKGVSRRTESTTDWRRLMEHFVIIQHDDCLARLRNCDVCGVNWHATPLPHFSGNFWWARSAYVRSLPSPNEHADACEKGARCPRMVIPRWWSCEFWIGANSQVRADSLHESGVDHYEVRYPRMRYAHLRDISITGSYCPLSAWKGLENQFQPLLEPIGKIKTVVEVGVEYGYSLFCLASALPDARVIGIDPYPRIDMGERRRLSRLGPQGVIGSVEAEAWVRAHLHEFPNVQLIVDTSANVARRFVGPVDVVHINGTHHFDDVQRDFAAWEPLVRPGGCVLFHDTQSLPDDVGRFFRNLPGFKTEISECSGLGAWYKPRPTVVSTALGRRRPSISLCMIVRDAELTLRKSLESIRPYVDEMVIVDTGSRDQTVELASILGARVHRFPWCDDFSAARNASLDVATGDWIVWMDADEWISEDNGAKLRHLVRGLPSDLPVGCVVGLQDVSSYDPHGVTIVQQIRLVRNWPGIRFIGRVHEQLLPSLRQLGAQIIHTDLCIEHASTRQSAAGRRRKQQRDRPLIERELNDAPDNAFQLLNLGMLLADQGDYERAVDLLSRSIMTASQTEPFLAYAYRALTRVLHELRRFPAAWHVCCKALEKFPRNAELIYHQGLLARELGEMERAVDCFQRALENHEISMLGVCETAVRTYLPHYELAKVHQEMSQIPVAIQHARLCVETAPHFCPAWRVLGISLLAQGQRDEVVALVERLKMNPVTQIEGRLLEARLAFQAGDYAAAESKVDAVLLEEPNDADALELLADCGLASGNCARAVRTVQQCPDAALQRRSLQQRAGLLYLHEGNLTAARSYLMREHSTDLNIEGVATPR